MVVNCGSHKTKLITPFTTSAKILVQHLWDKERGWDDPLLPKSLLQEWSKRESELQDLPKITLPRCYDPGSNHYQLHIFSDASERAYGAVAYLRSEDSNGQVHVAFLMARSRVAPKRKLSMPRLELSAALCGAQLTDLLHRELTLPIESSLVVRLHHSLALDQLRLVQIQGVCGHLSSRDPGTHLSV